MRSFFTWFFETARTGADPTLFGAGELAREADADVYSDPTSGGVVGRLTDDWDWLVLRDRCFATGVEVSDGAAAGGNEGNSGFDVSTTRKTLGCRVVEGSVVRETALAGVSGRELFAAEGPTLTSLWLRADPLEGDESRDLSGTEVSSLFGFFAGVSLGTFAPLAAGVAGASSLGFCSARSTLVTDGLSGVCSDILDFVARERLGVSVVVLSSVAGAAPGADSSEVDVFSTLRSPILPAFVNPGGARIADAGPGGCGVGEAVLASLGSSAVGWACGSEDPGRTDGVPDRRAIGDSPSPLKGEGKRLLDWSLCFIGGASGGKSSSVAGKESAHVPELT